MTIALCIDDKNGMMFNKRRQSRDRLLIKDLIASLDGRKLLVNSFSAPLFSEYPDSIEIMENPLDHAGGNDVCFVENIDPSSYADKADRIILYRWNRHYPSDMKLTLDLGAYRLLSSRDFAGSSHEKITREDYTK